MYKDANNQNGRNCCFKLITVNAPRNEWRNFRKYIKKNNFLNYVDTIDGCINFYADRDKFKDSFALLSGKYPNIRFYFSFADNLCIGNISICDGIVLEQDDYGIPSVDMYKLCCDGYKYQRTMELNNQ